MDKRYFLAIIFALIFGTITGFSAIDGVQQHNQRTDSNFVEMPVLEWNMPYNDTIELQPNYIFIPLIFEKHEINDSVKIAAVPSTEKKAFEVDDKWLLEEIDKYKNASRIRFNAIVSQPQNVKYNLEMLPEPPKHYFITADPSKNTLTLEERKIESVYVIENEKVIPRNWIHTLSGSIQFSQAYVSENWYQGGNNNLNALGNFQWNVKLNPNVYKKVIFENNVQYKLSIYSNPQDSIRKYSISEDLFQLNTKFGYKAYHNWYYSMTLLFKTQFLNNYTANTNNMKTSFLTPGELNLGLGMSYSGKTKYDVAVFSLSVAPASMNMKYCRLIDKVNPTTFGIPEGKHLNFDLGSNIEAKLVWRMTPNVTWTSRLFTFSNYEYVQGDWENTFNFSINKYLSTQLYLHLRYDSSVDIVNEKWKYWQFKEILSLGLNYKFML